MAESIKTKHENWLRVVWGLLYVRNGLQGYVDTKGKQQYQTFMKNVNANCNSQTCDQCQVNCGCQKGIQIPISQFNKGHFCDEMKKEIQNNHAKKPFWNNTDSTKWQDPNKGYWEVAKCFLSTDGYFDTTGPIEVDASGLLSICINSSIVNQQITDIQAFIDVRNIRNKTLHDARYEMDGKKADDCLEKMITVLEDQNELKHDTDAQKAANHIRKIKDKTEKTPANMIEDLHKCLQTNFDVDKAIKEIECSMYGRLRKELKEYVDDVVEGKVKIVFEQEMRKLKDLHERGTDESEDNVEDLRQRLAKYYHERLNHALISPMFLEEKLDKFYVPPKIFEKNARNIGVAEKRKGTPVTSYRHLICKTGKFGDLVFIVGEAGMGKSSCAAMCALKWANQVLSTNTSNEPEEYASHRRSLESTELEKLIQSNSDLEHMFLTNAKLDDQFQDDTFFQKVEFLFHLILRDSCHLCDLTDMIQDQLIQSIYPLDKTIAAVSTLHSVLSNKKCVIIVDGLDEWTHPNDTNYERPTTN
ncbi:hypothetical protein MAR_002993 [Mya arenaria]|uniref:DZIP3-like HEPN domain-containing protein n=1 Tax=Mya arenaria TaxID=6604 RepID=A0ABY7G4R1_MYAAR|nr:hypothetical protein MAR_002993 [Mya arenaria]